MGARSVARVVIVCGLLLGPAGAAWAQVSDAASIAGVVRDTSGAVLPGVTVEAASPALIDRVRSAITDGQGLYRIIDLRPGVYSVTFTLPGFSTFKRDGLELTTGFTARLAAELKVSAIEETITVSGETPVVDIQSSRQQTTLARATLDALPTSGRVSQYANIIPGAVLGVAANQSVGGLDERANNFGIHGNRSTDNAPVQDGMVQRLQGGAIFVFNNLTFQEVVVETSGMTAERNTGGVQMNIVPKDGGNTFSGSFSTSHSGPSFQRDNLNDDLRARGLRVTPPAVKKHYDTGGALGGPIKRDRLWFFSAFRGAANQQYQQGNYFNKLQNNPVGTDKVWRVLFYEPDLDRPGYTDDYYRDYSLRLTWQAAAKHKFVASFQMQPNCSCFWPLLEPQAGVGGTPLAAPEAVGRHNYKSNFMPIVTWTNPATNRLLLEAGWSANIFDNDTRRQEGVGADAIAITELSQNLRYGARALTLTHAGGYRPQHNRQYHGRFSGSYISGAHALKTGVDVNQYVEGVPGVANDQNQINGARSYVFNNRVPQQVTIWAVPFESLSLSRDIGVYAQDQWTVRRLTLNLGVRYTDFDGTVPETHMPAGPFVGARDFPAVKHSPHWRNVNPRLGVAYDLFGDGKTALKASWGRYTPYIGGQAGVVDIPALNQAASTTRTWNDSFFPVGDPRRGNYVPDCDLKNSVAHDECGAWDQATFGQLRGSNTRRAEDALRGFNQQDYNWQGSVSVQHELRTNVALNVGYFRTSYGGLLGTENQAVKPTDYDPFCVTVPQDSRLPGGGGNQICGLNDIKPTLFGQVNNLVTQVAHYGKQTEVYNGLDVTLKARFGDGGQLSGGLSTGQTVTDTCDLNNLPQVVPNNIGPVAASTTILTPRLPGFCHISRPWAAATQIKFLAIYPLPWDFQVSATYMNIPGIPITASRSFSNAEVLPSLGRNLGQCRGAATCTGTVTIDMVPPNTTFEDRLNEVDVRFTRSFRLAKVRVRGNADLYNLLNAADVLNMTTRYSGLTGGQWLQPTQILGGRLFKISAQLDF